MLRRHRSPKGGPAVEVERRRPPKVTTARWCQRSYMISCAVSLAGARATLLAIATRATRAPTPITGRR
eukprot:3733790-Lingulodinium_polyedra.AAC.1